MPKICFKINFYMVYDQPSYIPSFLCFLYLGSHKKKSQVAKFKKPQSGDYEQEVQGYHRLM